MINVAGLTPSLTIRKEQMPEQDNRERLNRLEDSFNDHFKLSIATSVNIAKIEQQVEAITESLDETREMNRNLFVGILVAIIVPTFTMLYQASNEPKWHPPHAPPEMSQKKN